MGIIQYPHEAIDAHASATAGIGGMIESEMQTIKGLVASLEGSFESRHAAPKFREVQAEVNQMQMAIRETVGTHAQVTRTGNTGMQDADAASGGGFGL